MNNTSPLVSVDWLKQNLANNQLVLLDASVENVVGKEPITYEFFSCIPGARHCDLAGDFHDSNNKQPNTMPSSVQFQQQAERLGVNNQSIVVIYDNQGIYSAPRAWWMFKAMGIEQVFVLNGGLPAWLKKGLQTDSKYSPSETGELTVNLDHQAVSSSGKVLSVIGSPQHKVIDVRSAGRFLGTAPEPRPGLRSGHIPGSVNIHFAKVLTEDGLKFKPVNELIALFNDAGISNSDDSQFILSCGSGMTACIVILAATLVKINNLSLYDGSWNEWGADAALPIEV